jgi:DNA/RNA-binding domain of Phe-tRNA-synthetase-like protein
VTVAAPLGAPPFAVELRLPGWALFWARLELLPGIDTAPESQSPAADPSPLTPLTPLTPLAALATFRGHVAARARERFAGEVARLPDEPVVAAVRSLFRAAGCDPTRYRPSSEALLRRLLKGEELPAIHPLVDLNNCLSVELAVPCGMLAGDVVQAPLELRAGQPDEVFLSLRGPFPLAGKPLLADALGPCGTPITDGERTSVRPATRGAWLVAYLPPRQLPPAAAHAALTALLAAAPVATLTAAAASPAAAAPYGG